MYSRLHFVVPYLYHNFKDSVVVSNLIKYLYINNMLLFVTARGSAQYAIENCEVFYAFANDSCHSKFMVET